MIKSEIIGKITENENNNKYPYIGKHVNERGNPIYVLFNSYRKGMLISTENPLHKIGDYHVNWFEEDFSRIDTNVVIKLSNK